MDKKQEVTVVELFAGVGGFRLGLEGHYGKSSSSGYKNFLKSKFKIIWSNQWEPSTKTQHASMVYNNNWNNSHHSNIDIMNVNTNEIPDHDLLVGGFPCQDYSVATTLKNSKGLIGKKGVLWWSIHKILNEKKNKPKYLIFENVDRLLISPSKQRGRDFAVILKSLSDLGYLVEWRVIDASEYGMPQKRKRIFLIGHHNSTLNFKSLNFQIANNWLNETGIFAKSFPIISSEKNELNEFIINQNLVEISENFNIKNIKGIFNNTGVFYKDKSYSFKSIPNYNGKYIKLGDIILEGEVDSTFYIPESEIKKWEYLKGAKKELRINSDGFQYKYTEGSMSFPDDLKKPSRTIITGEGGSSPSRFKHVILTKEGFRRLTPIELERLNMFPDNHTKLKNVSDSKRAFFMGNALVVGVVEKIGENLYKEFLK